MITPTLYNELFKSIFIYSFTGRVTTGYGRGSRKLGFPTANLPHFDTALTKYAANNGMYFGWLTIEVLPYENTVYPCVANIGISPTFVNEVRLHPTHKLLLQIIAAYVHQLGEFSKDHRSACTQHHAA